MPEDSIPVATVENAERLAIGILENELQMRGIHLTCGLEHFEKGKLFLPDIPGTSFACRRERTDRHLGTVLLIRSDETVAAPVAGNAPLTEGNILRAQARQSPFRPREQHHRGNKDVVRSGQHKGTRAQQA